MPIQQMKQTHSKVNINFLTTRLSNLKEAKALGFSDGSTSAYYERITCKMHKI